MQPRVPVLVGIAVFMLLTPIFATMELTSENFALIVLITLWCYVLGLAGMFVVLARSTDYLDQ